MRISCKPSAPRARKVKLIYSQTRRPGSHLHSSLLPAAECQPGEGLSSAHPARAHAAAGVRRGGEAELAARGLLPAGLHLHNTLGTSPCPLLTPCWSFSPCLFPTGPCPATQEHPQHRSTAVGWEASPARHPPRLLAPAPARCSPQGPLLMTLMRLCWLHWAFSSSHSLL